jgi:hypothetical protein
MGELVVVSPPASRGIGPQHQSPPPPPPPHRLRGHEATNGRATCDRRGEGDKVHDASSQHHGQEGGVSSGIWDVSRLACNLASDARPLRRASNVLCIVYVSERSAWPLRGSLRDSAAPPDLRSSEKGQPILAPGPAIRQTFPRAKSDRRSEAQRGKPDSGMQALCNILFTQSSAISGPSRDPRGPRGYFLLEVAAPSISDFRGVRPTT